MTKQHFEAIARGLADAMDQCRNNKERSLMNYTITAVASEIGGFNRSFNRARFLTACNYWAPKA